MTKNIIFDCERMKYPHTGLYNFCLQLGNALLQNTDSIRENISFYMPSSAGKMFGENAGYISQNFLHKLLPPSSNGFSIWHTTNQESGYAPNHKKVKRVLTIHDLNFLYEHTHRPEKIKRSLRKIQRKINKADKICAISEYVKRDVESKLELNGKQIEVIYNGCNIKHLADPHPPKSVPAHPFIFSIGTITAKKNFHVLPALLQNNDLLLVIAGITLQEDYIIKIKEEARKYNVQDRLVFAGGISENDKEWYLKNCEAFVFPSIAEGFGLPVIEAMAFGKPVFLSTATSLPEIGGDVAYYFESFDPDCMLNTFQQGMNHYKELQPLEAIKKRAQMFSWDKAAAKYMEIYRQLY